MRNDKTRLPRPAKPRYRLIADDGWTEYRVYAGDTLLSGGVVRTREEARRLAKEEIGRLSCR